MENHGKSMECNNNQRVTPFILNAVGLSDNDPKSKFPQPRTTSILFSNAVALLTSHTALRLYTAALKLGAQFLASLAVRCNWLLQRLSTNEEARVKPCLSLYEICPGNYAGR